MHAHASAGKLFTRCVWCKLKSDKVTLVVATYGAVFGSFLSGEDVTAVKAHPLTFHVGYKKFALF